MIETVAKDLYELPKKPVKRAGSTSINQEENRMASLSLKNVTKKYPNGFVAVKDFNLEIADKGIHQSS